MRLGALAFLERPSPYPLPEGEGQLLLPLLLGGGGSPEVRGPMRRTVACILVSACLVGLAAAGQPDAEPPPTRLRYHLWKAPFYLVLGLPRDLLDAPVKGLSSIPYFNYAFLPVLTILNAFTTVAAWSFTEEGVDGGFEAWIACLQMRRQKGAHTPDAFQDRPKWKNYFPNYYSFRIITREPVPQ